MTEASTSTDRTLWRAVIAQALYDATRKLPATRSATQRRDRDDARQWLTQPNRDFTHVCHLAEFEPDAIRRLAVQRISDVDEGRAVASQAKSKPPAAKAALIQSTAQPRRTRGSSPFNRQRLGPKPVIYTHHGLSMTLKQWAKHLGMPYQTLCNRLRMKWQIADVLSTKNYRGSKQKMRPTS
jgi:hypothetical protein